MENDTPITNADELEEAIKYRAESIVEELGYEWNEIPGAIAYGAVLNLTMDVAGRLPKGGTTTLIELGQMLGTYDAEGNPL